jgi:hypothetical protein
MKLFHTLLAVGLVTAAACHPGPVVGTGGRPLAVGGTIAGIVSTDTNTAVAGRKVTAVNTETGARVETTTGVNGGFTMKVPEGTYRLELELRPGETVVKQPGDTRVNRSDLDPRRDFVITLRPPSLS